MECDSRSTARTGEGPEAVIEPAWAAASWQDWDPEPMARPGEASFGQRGAQLRGLAGGLDTPPSWSS